MQYCYTRFLFAMGLVDAMHVSDPEILYSHKYSMWEQLSGGLHD